MHRMQNQFVKLEPETACRQGAVCFTRLYNLTQGNQPVRGMVAVSPRVYLEDKAAVCTGFL